MPIIIYCANETNNFCIFLEESNTERHGNLYFLFVVVAQKTSLSDYKPRMSVQAIRHDFFFVSAAL